MAKRGGELVTESNQEELKKEILDEVLSLTQLFEHCTPSLVPCIKQSFISMDGSSHVQEEYAS